jgi:protein-glutamine gamma-glutamyltransferase
MFKMFNAKGVPLLVLICSLLGLLALWDRYLNNPGLFICVIPPMMLLALRRIGMRLGMPRILAIILVVLLILFLNFAVFVLKFQPETALVFFLTILVLAKCFILCKVSDYSQLMFLSVLSMLAAGAYNPTATFPLFFLTYTLLAGYTIFQFHLLTEVLSHRRIKESIPTMIIPASRQGGFQSFLGTTVVTCSLALVIFSFIPRQAPNWNFGDQFGSQQVPTTGFSPEMELGRMAETLQDRSAVLRVKCIQDEKHKGYNRNLYLRGLVLSQYVRMGTNCWKWIENRLGRPIAIEQLSPLSNSVQFQKPHLPADRQIWWRISFEDAVSTNLFVIDRPFAIAANRPQPLKYDAGNNTISAGSQFQSKGFVYELMTEEVPNLFKPSPLPPVETMPAGPSGRLFRPSGYGKNAPMLETEPVKVVELAPFKPLAKKVIGSLPAGATAQEKVQKIENWLKSNFQYTLDNTDVDRSKEPIMDFLMRRKHGHCEYFASALTVLTRTLGMEAQVVIGFKGGVFNSFGDYYLVRNCDAHAWVEVFFPNKGWVRFDPTPPGRDDVIRERDDATFKWFWDLVDLMQYSWADKLASMASNERKEFIKNLQQKVTGPENPEGEKKWSLSRLFKSIANLIKGQDYESVWLQVLHSLVAILVLVLVALLARIVYVVAGIVWALARENLRRRWEKRFGSLWFCPVEFYRRPLLWLANRGITRTGTETAWEFAHRIGTLHPGIDHNFRFLTENYLAVRFGKRKLSSSQKENVNQAAREIQSALGEKEKKVSRRGAGVNP